MTIAVDLGRKATKTNKQTNSIIRTHMSWKSGVDPDQLASRSTLFSIVYFWFHTGFKRLLHVYCLSSLSVKPSSLCISVLWKSITLFGQVFYDHLLIPGQVLSFAISTSLNFRQINNYF